MFCHTPLFLKDVMNEKDNLILLSKTDPEEAVRKFECMTNGQIRTGRVYHQKTPEERKQEYLEAKELRRFIKDNRVPFITSKFLPEFYLCQGLIVVGAESGRGKSTVAANILAGFLREIKDKPAIVISNEEATDAVYERVACCLLGVNYNAFFKGLLGARQVERVQDYVHNEVVPRVEVVSEGKFDMAVLEDVQAVLETAAANRNGLVILDYLQVITQSRENPQMESYAVSKQLGLYLKGYGKKNAVPVVTLAQLYSESRAPNMAERVQNDKTIFNHGFICIEAKPDFETLETTFKVHKDRFFGHTGKEVIMKYDGGRFLMDETQGI